MSEAGQTNLSVNMENKNLTISLEDVIANLPGHVYWLDRDYVYQGCNNLQAKALGLHSNLDIIGKKNTDFTNLDRSIAEVWDKNNLDVMTSGSAKIFEEPTIFEGDRMATVLSHKKPLVDNQGNIIGIIGISLDLTEKNEAEVVLRNKINGLDITLENIITNLPGHIYWQDVNNVFLGCNDAQAKSAGLKHRNDIIGKTNYDLPWHEQAKSLNDINNEVMRTGREYSIEERADLSNGQHYFFLSKKVPMFDNNRNIVGIMGISFDITERKKMEEELRTAKKQAEISNKAKTEFLENMRHDIRTPLSGIVGFSELLVGESDKDKIKIYTDGLAESSHELLRFLNEMLESINVISGDIPLLKKRFDLKSVLSNVIKLHRSKALKKGLDLELFYDEDIPQYLIGDPIRIYRIVLELLGNALKFTEYGFVNVLVNLYKKNDQNVVIQIVIEDTGPGIPKDKQEEIFVRFKRLTPSYKGIYEGSGLGLSIIKQFIDDLQGEIYVDSVQSIGTRFICVIKLQEALWVEQEEKTPLILQGKNTTIQPDYAYNKDIAKKQISSLHKASVLVVDDQLIALSVVKSILSDFGCEVECVSDAESALELVKHKKYDLIFMDIGLPGINGYEATKLIRANKQSDCTFIVGLTGHEEQNKKQLGLDSGMNIILNKPLTHEIAYDVLKKFIINSHNFAEKVIFSQ